jgi:PAS domain S-box-containing protein
MWVDVHAFVRESLSMSTAPALRPSPAVYEALFELAPDAILLVDTDGRIAHVNAHAEEVFGYRRDEVIGRPIELFVPERHRRAHAGHRAGYARQPRTRSMGQGLELVGRRKDGSEVPVEIALAHIATESGPMALAIVRDVSKRRAAETALRRAHDDLERRVAERTRELSDANRRLVEEHAKLVRAEKLSSIGLLAAGVAHEINNPLSGVMGLVRSLRQGTVPEPKRDEYFETVRDGLERMRVTVQGLLEYARPRAPTRSRVDAVEMVSACLRLVAPATRKKDVAIELQIPGATRPLVHADRSQLMQAVVNVVMNAIYVAPAGSTIDTVVVADGPRVGIRVVDRGPGIPRDDLARVCDPFFSTKPEGEGTGLGLAITLGILEAHGGELAIDSEPGRGTAVTLWLPTLEGAFDHA